MRTLILLTGLLVVASGTARAESLWDGELRLGYGVALGGGPGMTTTRVSPLTIAGIASIAIEEEPRLDGYGGVIIETLDRTSIGSLFGIKLSPRDTPLRFTAGGTYVFAPFTLWGATASAGVCHRVGRAVQLCGDLQLTAYFAGTDLPDDHAVTQGQLTLGLVIDAP